MKTYNCWLRLNKKELNLVVGKINRRFSSDSEAIAYFKTYMGDGSAFEIFRTEGEGETAKEHLIHRSKAARMMFSQQLTLFGGEDNE